MTAPAAAESPETGEGEASPAPRRFPLHRLSRDEWRLLVFVLSMKALLLWIGVISAEVYGDQRLSGGLSWLEIWNRWDAPHYLQIAEYGYQDTGEHKYNLAFFPFFPLLVRMGMNAGLPPVAAAFAVSTIASLFAAVLLYRLLRLDARGNASRRGVWLFFAFPTAYFLHIGYTESLFYGLLFGAFYRARQRHWVWAGTLGFLAAATRMNGLLLIPALLFEAWAEWRETRRFNPGWIFLFAVTAGVGLYLLVNWQATGHPLTFLRFQKENWNHNLAWPWTGILYAAQNARHFGAADGHLLGVMEALFALIGFGAVLCMMVFRCRASYVVWSLGNWALFCSMDFLTSTPRYTLLLFPLFLLLGRATVRPAFLMMILAWSLLFQALFAGMFAQGRWAF